MLTQQGFIWGDGERFAPPPFGNHSHVRHSDICPSPLH